MRPLTHARKYKRNRKISDMHGTVNGSGMWWQRRNGHSGIGGRSSAVELEQGGLDGNADILSAVCFFQLEAEDELE